MSIAEEIKSLKELLDTGVLSKDEFERAKDGLLNKVSSPSKTSHDLNHFVGKWRMYSNNVDQEMEIDLLIDGNAKIKNVDKNLRSNDSLLESMLISASNVCNGTGKWWLNQNHLFMNFRFGNSLGQAILKKQSISQNLDLDGEVTSVSQSEIKIIDGTRLIRIGLSK